MLGDKHKARSNSFGWESDFRRYKILVKIFRQNMVEQQNLEIFTTGLQQLLELRRLHTIAFKTQDVDDIREWAAKN